VLQTGVVVVGCGWRGNIMSGSAFAVSPTKDLNICDELCRIYVNSYLIKFLLRILGALTAAPTRLEPVSQIPQAAPTTDNPRPNAMPKLA
jgi:hypothetical protein